MCASVRVAVGIAAAAAVLVAAGAGAGARRRRGELHGLSTAAVSSWPSTSLPPPTASLTTEPDTPPTVTSLSSAVPANAHSGELSDKSLQKSSLSREEYASDLGSSTANKNSLPEWFPKTVCTAGVNHTSVAPPTTTPAPTPEEPELETPFTTLQEAPATEPESSVAKPETSMPAAAPAAFSTAPPPPPPPPSRAYRAPPSPEPAAFYVDDA